MSWKAVPAFLILAVFLLLLGFGGGHGSAAPRGLAPVSAAKGDAVRGREVFAGTCSFCHGASGRGMKGFGRDLVDQSAWMKQQSDADLVAFIKRGRAATDPLNESGFDMLPLGGNPTLTDRDLHDVVAYLRSLQRK